jgi:hypothetical protein
MLSAFGYEEIEQRLDGLLTPYRIATSAARGPAVACVAFEARHGTRTVAAFDIT